MSRQENDTIYRQETTKHLKHRLYETATNNPDIAGVFSEIADNRVETWIEELPSAQQRWIPVTERLPEDGENVLVTYKTTDKIHPCQYHDDGSLNPWYSYIDQCRAHMNVVLAWMPLPESYTEEEE